MSTLQRIPVIIAVLLALMIAAASSGFFIGKNTEKAKQMKADNTAFQKSREVENEVNTLNPYSRCLAVGGLPDECKILMRGLDKTAKGQ